MVAVLPRRQFIALPFAAGLSAASRKTWAGIRFQLLRKGRSNRRYLWIHGDETTAGAVLAEHMKSHRGAALLVDNPTRTIKSFTLEFDPNRMFTAEGLERNLKRLNPTASPEQIRAALTLVARDREKILRQITPPPSGLLIALHNNSRGYSVHDEVPISNKTSIPNPADPNAFFLCTHPPDFELLAKTPYNVVLQNDPQGEEDGSMSRLAAKRKIRYVNLEVALGQPEKQRTMLEALVVLP